MNRTLTRILILFMGLLVLTASCRREPAQEPNKAPILGKVVELQHSEEIADLLQSYSLRNVPKTPEPVPSAETITKPDTPPLTLQTKKIDENRIKNAYQQARAGQWDEAVKLAVTISDPAERDVLLENIVLLQLNEALELFQKATTETETIDGQFSSIHQILHQTVQTIEHIENPLMSANTSHQIAQMFLKIKNRNAAAEMMNKAAEHCRNSPNSAAKVKGLTVCVLWFFEEETPEKTLALCHDWEATLVDVKESAIRNVAYMELSKIYSLLGKTEDSLRILDLIKKMKTDADAE